jgi:hypothetical protein
LCKRYVSTDVCWGHQQPTVISTVHEVAVGAALAVWALRICGVTVKLLVPVGASLGWGKARSESGWWGQGSRLAKYCQSRRKEPRFEPPRGLVGDGSSKRPTGT